MVMVVRHVALMTRGRKPTSGGASASEPDGHGVRGRQPPAIAKGQVRLLVRRRWSGGVVGRHAALKRLRHPFDPGLDHDKQHADGAGCAASASNACVPGSTPGVGSTCFMSSSGRARGSYPRRWRFESAVEHSSPNAANPEAADSALLRPKERYHGSTPGSGATPG